MEMNTAIFLLTSGVFITSRSADGQPNNLDGEPNNLDEEANHLPGLPELPGTPHLPGQPNLPGQHHLPHSSIMVTMHDQCYYMANPLWLRSPREEPAYELSHHVHPWDYHFDIFIGRRHFAGTLDQIHLGVLNQHVHQNHTPQVAHIHIGDGEFYIADDFRPFNSLLHAYNYDATGHRVNYVPTNHVYVATPNRNEYTYSSRFRSMPITGEDYLHSGTAHVLNLMSKNPRK